MVNVLLIGAGNIGSRHLQGLAKVKTPISIFVIDPSTDSLKLSKSRFEEVDGHNNINIKSIEFIQDITSLTKRIEIVDVAIIATFADIRASIVSDLISNFKLINLILEKVVFQSESEFDNITNLLKQNGVKCWVNCPRRYWSGYKILKNQITKLKSEIKDIIINITGSNLGIGCNGIHFIDIIGNLTGQTKFEYQLEPHLNSEIQAIRNGKFYEFTGTLHGELINSDLLASISFSLTSFDTGDAPILIDIRSNLFSINVDEQKGKITARYSSNGWEEIEIALGTTYQSSLTNIIVDEILKEQNCSLTPLDESEYHHRPFLNTLLQFFNQQMKETRTRCPIT